MNVVTVTLNPALDQTVMLDGLAPGAVHRALGLRKDAGGKGINVAACLADWGVPVTATGVLGQDNAAPFQALMEAKGIEGCFAWIPGETRTNLKLLDGASGDTTDINLPGLTVTADALVTVRAVLRERAGRDALVVLAGSLPGGLPAETYADLTAELRGRGARVILDASGPALAAALAGPALPFAIKPNRYELEEWAGRPLPTLGDVADAAERLTARGIALVAVSLGPEGALFVSETETLHALPPPTEIASTVGAGDALVAGIVAGLQAGLALSDTARLALAFAAGKLTQAGANLPPRAAVQAIAATVRVERLST